MTYVDVMAAAVPTANKDAYIAHARMAAEIFKEHGALRVLEFWGDDVPQGQVTSFPLAVKCAADETVCCSLIEWPSRSVRDAGMQKVMSDARMASEDAAMPFDGQRMIFGGFEMILDA